MCDGVRRYGQTDMYTLYYMF